MTGWMWALWGACQGETPPPEPAPAPPPAPAPASAPEPAPLRQQLQRVETTVGGVTRVSWLHVPDQRPAGLLPLVVLLHGGQQADARRLAALVDGGFDQGVFYLFPDSGIPAPEEEGKAGKRERDGGREDEDEDEDEEDDAPPSEPQWAGDEDLTFVEVVADQIARSWSVDRSRLFLGGFAEGAELALELACSESGSSTFAGFAVVGAALPRDLQCPAPGFPRPVLLVGGTADEVTPWTGDRHHLPVADTAATFLPKDECDPATAKVEDLPDADGSDGTQVRRHTWTCAKAPVELLEIVGGGHAWPRKSGRMPPKTSREVDLVAEWTRLFDLARAPAPAPEGASPEAPPAPAPAKAGKRHKHKSG